MTAAVSLVQGIYFFLTGIWPILSIGTFQMVTGPKNDLWLVKTVGVLIAAIGLSLLIASWRREDSYAIAALGLGSAAALAGIDVVYVWLDVISPIYLADAAAEALLILWWSAALVRMRAALRVL
jgi:hypothetical protein